MREPRATGISDAAMLALIGGAAALAAAVWLWGGLAGLMFGRGWPHVAAGQLPSVMVRLPARLAEPAAAWPPGARALLPGAAGFYAALGGAGGVWRPRWSPARRARDCRRGCGSRTAGARWAAARRAAGAARPRPTRAGSALGRCRGRLLYAEQRHALVAFGPPQSGKSAGLAVPALLEWEGPAVASSIKTDLLASTLARRRALGPVFVFDPFELSGAEGQTWSPLRGAATMGRRAGGRVAAGGGRRAGSARRGGRLVAVAGRVELGWGARGRVAPGGGRRA